MADSLELRCAGQQACAAIERQLPSGGGCPAVGHQNIGAQLAEALSKALARVTAAHHQQTLARTQRVDSSSRSEYTCITH